MEYNTDQLNPLRCPKLGHEVPFEYCIVENTDLPCSRAIKCWAAYLDAQAYFTERLSAEQFTKCFLEPPKPKMTSLLELIEQAKKSLPQS